MKARLQPSVDNSEIEAFFETCKPVVELWNKLHSKQCEGRLVLEVNGGDRREPKKIVKLSADTGTEIRPFPIILLVVELDDETGKLTGGIPSLPIFDKRPVDAEYFQEIIEDFRPSA